jgi:hypothetical protein
MGTIPDQARLSKEMGLGLPAVCTDHTMIPAGTPHHVANPGKVPLFFMTVYAPPAY